MATAVAPAPAPAPAPAASSAFSLDAETELLRGEVRRFAEGVIAPGRSERDRLREFPAWIVEQMGEMGLLAMMVPERYGGPGMSTLAYLVAVEELARICPSMAVTMSVTNSVCCWPIQRYGSEHQKDTILRQLASGANLGGFGLTEPESGSDPASLRTTARRSGASWILDGEKAWITNAGVARWFVVMARTDPEAGKKGISAFLVPGDAAGLTVGTPEAKLGLHASKTAPLVFSNCEIPENALLGAPGEGLRIALSTLDHSRLGIAAQALGMHRRALELSCEYARQRVQFGRPIAEHQAIRFTLARMATELEAARVLTWGAALRDSTPQAGRWAAQAKLYASEAAVRAVADAVQIHGGNGFSDDYEVSRLYRDVRVTTIYEGTSEMQRLVVARHLLRDR